MSIKFQHSLVGFDSFHFATWYDHCQLHYLNDALNGQSFSSWIYSTNCIWQNNSICTILHWICHLDWKIWRKKRKWNCMQSARREMKTWCRFYRNNCDKYVLTENLFDIDWQSVNSSSLRCIQISISLLAMFIKMVINYIIIFHRTTITDTNTQIVRPNWSEKQTQNKRTTLNIIWWIAYKRKYFRRKVKDICHRHVYQNMGNHNVRELQKNTIGNNVQHEFDNHFCV